MWNKWLFVGLITLLSVGISLADPPANHPTTGAPLVIDCLRGTPDAIDGDLSDWNLAAMTPAVLDSADQIYTGTWGGVDDLSAEFYVLWDDVNVYIAAIVHDDALSTSKSGGDIWNADCIEVFFSTTNAVATGDHSEHYQYGFNVINQKYIWDDMEGSAAEPAYLTVVSSITDDGYICEVSIPYGEITPLDWSVGSEIGFHPCVDDTEATDREIQMTWTGLEAHDQSTSFGRIILSDQRAIAKELAKDPSPANGATGLPLDTTLSWSAGEYAVAHDVYMGTSFDDVNDGTTPTSAGQSATTYDPGMLEYGQTYYWRIDEVNGAPDNTVFKGEVWSFSTEAFADPIKGVIATSNVPAEAGSGPEKTVDGSGLNDADQHSVDAPDTWLALPTVDEMPWIQYEFDSVYKLHQMMVWNYNSQFEMVLGFGIKDVTVEYSENGTDWIVLGDEVFAQATARATYTANTVVDFGGVPVKYVRLTVINGYGPMGQYGLSEVRFLAIPVQAREPDPADGALQVDPSTALTWRAGREAASHEVYLSTDEGAVADGTALAGTVDDATYAAAGLEFGSVYYWKVNEVNEAEAVSTWEGAIWSFTTQAYAVIDDMESYNDEDNVIYETWIDGWINGTGSTVGYLLAPFAEQSVVHGGGQSMPLAYDNSFAPFYSEAEFDMGGADLTVGGAENLRLFVEGEAPSFFEAADGSIMMNAIGADIWGTADQFRYAYKNLTGDGSMIARVDEIGASTDGWAKAGVMIRQATGTGSQHSFMAMTSGDGNGASFQGRPEQGLDSVNADATSAVAPPYWVRIDRAGNTLTGFVSEDGQNWTQIGDPRDVAMTGSVLIGLALCSHNASSATSATFSEVSFTGSVSGNWQIAEIGLEQPEGNIPESLYVAVEDTAGNVAVAMNPDDAATARPGWSEWIIPYSELTGVNLGSVRTLYIGVGDRDNPSAGGAGLVFIDDIGFGKPGASAVENLLANGGFEDGAMAPWSTYGDVTAEVVTDDPAEGSACLHVTVNAAGANFWDAGLQHTGHVFEAGKQYTLSAYLKCSEGTRDINFKPELAADPWSGFGDQVLTMTDEWAQFSVTTPVLEEDVDPAAITFHIAFTAGEFWIDDVQFYEVQ